MLFLFLLPLAGDAQVIFSAQGDVQTVTGLKSVGTVAVRPGLILAAPGEFYGGTAFTGRMRPRVFAYHVMQTQPSVGPEEVLLANSYPWKLAITTTVFWIGEPASLHSPDNVHSAWDREWRVNYGGTDTPRSSGREDFRPLGFVPRENPFYIALPYNDQCPGGIRAEASTVIPWFDPSVAAQGKSNLKGRWVAIRKAARTCYAQWEDVGPFDVDNWEYVFGNERPRHNHNKDAGLDVSPAVRDYLGLSGIDVADWRFVEKGEVPDGPWKCSVRTRAGVSICSPASWLRRSAPSLALERLTR